MRHIPFLFFVLMLISLACTNASSAERRALGEEWRLPSTSHGEVEHYLKVAGPGKKSIDQEHSEEIQNSKNMDADDIVYNIDYHGATTHPTPTPKHPRP